MPEGDTVWRAARLLDRALAGQTLLDSDFRVPSIATVDLSGARIAGTVSRGKHLLTRIDAATPLTLHTHLKMEGAWQAYRAGERWRRPVHTARVVLTTAAGSAVGFSLGVVELVPRSTEDELVGHLGPDLLGPDWDRDTALARLLATPETPVVQAIQDQTRLAGVGNMYANELCFLAGLAPQLAIGEVPDPRRLVDRAKSVLEANKVRASQSTTGDLRKGRRTWVYRQRGCLRCGTTISTTMIGAPGRERATYWCASCQPAR
ncbi:DNA-formamidopyrimidine glycosylase family protein [Nocardioides gilvus]|uniref:DNA-formamidopyrimidine glycosylase family protein n=1 Tax=Nocardioides gilvus TaxID=1735589 RepID=UPI000D7494CF|nr:DNA-formamidopyrimidine glycosylase family protein [Nocardioides gilvus]